MDKLKVSLGLSDEQVAKLSANRAEMSDKMKTLRENSSLDETAKKQQMGAWKKEQKEKMKSILTEEQLKKYEELKKDKHGKMGDRSKN